MVPTGVSCSVPARGAYRRHIKPRVFLAGLARVRGERVGRAEHDTAGLDGVKALPDHADDRAGKHWSCQRTHSQKLMCSFRSYVVTDSLYLTSLGKKGLSARSP
jgi:hypothetical protein